MARSIKAGRSMTDSEPCRMSTLPVSELCLLNFLEETADVTDWYMLGLYMGVPPRDLAHIEKQSSSQGSARCRAEMFGVDETNTECLVGTDRSSSGKVRRNCTG